MKISKEMRDQLRAPLPAGAVKPHPTKTYLSSIKAIYVTERFNDVFGVGAWQIKVDKESVNDKGMVVVKVVFEIPEYGVYYECYGGNDNGGESSKNFDLGDAFKGATTDAMTKIGSWMEVGIDVFKGKVSVPPPKSKPELLPTDKKNWDKVVIAMRGGYTLEQIRTKWTVSNENAFKLNTDVNATV